MRRVGEGSRTGPARGSRWGGGASGFLPQPALLKALLLGAEVMPSRGFVGVKLRETRWLSPMWPLH